MPTDAKCGLLVGVGLVLAVAVLFFQKDPPPAEMSPTPSPSPAAEMKPPTAAAKRPGGTFAAPGRPVSRPADDDPLRSKLPQ